jgi:hypothetical protein
MGVFAFGPSATSVDLPGIAEAMRPALEAWMSARVQIWDPKRAGTLGNYDPTADTGGFPTAALVYDSGENGAIVQPIRSPGRVTVGQQATGIQSIRFQLKRIAPELGTTLRGGLRLRVLNGGNDPQLEALVFSLGDAFSSSLAWDHIFEATVLTGR